MCWKIGQVVAVYMCCDLQAQYHILVQSDDGCHHIHYLDELESYALCLNGKKWVGQLVVVDAAS